ncbi:IclR family transcriptional regulator [Amycolatopsis sacchari]|uniref:IclR family transcriptional regulator n=1 Tax=Amycolatopsis sacchari TaxID=115433 RepID=UPI003D7090AC
MGDSAERTPGRGVLEGAFQVLDVLAAERDGAGLSEVARAGGLPKATAYRLLEQLVGIGAVQRHGQRYFVGKVLARLGQAWQPHPQLRAAALGPVRTLASLSATAVAVTVLHGDRVRIVAATRGALGELPQMRADSDLASRTAAGRVLLAAQPGAEPPDGYSRAEWRRIRDGLRHETTIAVDHQEAVPGICCVAAPVVLPRQQGIASISALVISRTVPQQLPDLLVRAAAEVTRNLGVR